jgi:hypothetical protein
MTLWRLLMLVWRLWTFFWRSLAPFGDHWRPPENQPAASEAFAKNGEIGTISGLNSISLLFAGT